MGLISSTRCWILVVSMGAVSFFSLADELDGSSLDLLDLSLEQLMKIEVTVATKNAVTALDAPSSVTIFTQQDIRNMGINSLDELLNYVPGMQSWFDTFFGAQNYASARGSIGQGNDVLYLYNGQRINNLQNNNGHSFNHLMAMQNIKQVEIIRGPGSALYGSGAFAAVINIVVDNELNNVQVEIGEHNSSRFALNWSFESESRDWSSSLFLHSFLRYFYTVFKMMVSSMKMLLISMIVLMIPEILNMAMI